MQLSYSDLVSFALMKLSNSGPMLTHMIGGDLTKPGQKNLFKSGLLEIDTLNSVDTFNYRVNDVKGKTNKGKNTTSL